MIGNMGYQAEGRTGLREGERMNAREKEAD